MKCPGCGTITVALETRMSGTNVRRRRRCPACSKRMTTIEVIVDTDGRRSLGSVVILPRATVDRLRAGAADLADRIAAVFDAAAPHPTAHETSDSKDAP